MILMFLKFETEDWKHLIFTEAQQIYSGVPGIWLM
jgi:hypothetical protein